MDAHPAASIFPLLAGEAFDALVADICRNGLQEPIWLDSEGRILDGRNRYRACQKANVEPRFQRYIGPADSALGFVVSLNLIRRHLDESQRAMVAARLAGMSKGRPSENASIEAFTQPEAAKHLNVSRASVQRAKKVLESGCGALVNAVERGSVAVGDAAAVTDLPQSEQEHLLKQVDDRTFRKLKGARHQAEIDKQREQIESGRITLPEGLFEVIVIDPPWPYDLTYDPEWRRGGIRYPNMSIEELQALELPAARDCILWLWTTNAFMPEACALLEPWDFKPKTILTWVKPRIGLGRWLRNCTEHCLLATKGKPHVALKNQSTVLEAPGREHSRKPDEFYALVESLCVGRKLDYFSREKRPGWEQFGNDCEQFGRVGS